MSYKLKEPQKFTKLVSEIKENIFPAEGPRTEFAEYHEQSLKAAIADLNNSDSLGTEDLVQFLNKYVDNLETIMKSLLKAKEEEDSQYWVITHGDSWINNFLFLHDKNKKVKKVKLVDFQVNYFNFLI